MCRKSLAGILAITVAGLLFGSSVLAQQSMDGTQHDFSNKGWSGGEICIACHTPHNADLSVSADAPLWNHTLAAATGYTLYAGFDMESTPTQPGTISRLCLSCHDGSVALDSFGGATGSSFIGGGKNLTRDLSNDHPISVTYDSGTITADGGLHALTNTYTVPVVGGTDTVFSGLLDNGTTVECSSCHDVHAKNVAPGSKLLKVNNSGSALCRACHTK